MPTIGVDDYNAIISPAKTECVSQLGPMSMKQKRPTSTGRLRLFIAAVVSSLGGFLFGYDNIVISGEIGQLEAGSSAVTAFNTFGIM